MQIARWFHLVGVVVWVGGMFFAHMALRPSVQALAPPERLTLLAATLTRFLSWVAVASLAVVASGFAMLSFMGAHAMANPWLASMAIAGLVMAGIYLFIVAGPFRALRDGVAAADWPRAGAAMQRVRRWVAVNLCLGMAVVTFGVLARG